MMESPNKDASGYEALDRELDTALAKYAQAEPRRGIEDRILANLRAAGEHAPARWGWSLPWRWRVVAAAVAVVVFLIVGLAWRSRMRPAPTTAQSPRTPLDAQSPVPRITSIQFPAPVTKAVRRRSHIAAAAPKLEQFPSPQPLSEQEKILAGYVAADPDRAVLLAGARIEALRRDQIEEMQSFSRDGWATDSEDRNNDTSEK